MLYFLHHPAGNVVIRTDNPYIVLQYQHKGWLTTTSFDEVLDQHPEWREPTSSSSATTPDAPAKSFVATLCRTLLGSLSATLALVPSYSPAGVATTAPLLARASPPNSLSSRQDERPSNTGPLYWLTAVERKWYWQRAQGAPFGSWVMCTEGDEAFDYRLEEGIWELELPPHYEEST